MGASREDIERALEWAKQNNDESAVRGLTKMLDEQSSGSLPPDYVPGQASAEIEAQSDPIPPSTLGQKPALASEADIDASAQRGMDRTEQRQSRAQEVQGALPWGKKTQSLIDETKEATKTEQASKIEKAQRQYEADQELLNDPANVPSEEEVDAWLKMQAGSYAPLTGATPPLNPSVYAPVATAANREVVRDPKTGKLRWTALPPSDIYSDEKGTTVARALLGGSIAGEAVNMVGRRLEDIEAEEEGISTFQKHVFRSLPKTEQDRVRQSLARSLNVDADKLTDDVIATKVTPYQLKKAIDENEENQAVYESLRAGESGVLERFKRAGTQISRGLAGAVTFDEAKDKAIDESNVFGAETPEGPVFEADTTEGYWLNKWEDRAASKGTAVNDIMHQLVIEPFKKFDPDLKVGSTVRYTADKMKQDAWGEYYERTQKPLLKPGTELLSWDDMTNPETYTDGTLLTDPMAFTLKAVEQGVNMAPGLVGGYAGGRLSKGMFPGAISKAGSLDMKVKELNRQILKQRVAGGTFGNAFGNSIVYDHAASEIRDTINLVPDEVLLENADVKAMMSSGNLTLEEVRQLLTQEAASNAGRGAYIGSTLITTPSAGLTGIGAGGSLLNKHATARVLVALGLAPAEEAGQELYEGYQTDIRIEEIDPENPILQDKGRFAERAFAGFAFALSTTGPFEAAAALEPSAPIGIDKDTVDAARTTDKFIDARNKRFAHEFKVTHPSYIDKTSAAERIIQLEKLQELQNKEADAILDMVEPVKKYMKEHPGPGRDADLSMLDALHRWGNATKTDIAVARSKRTTAREMLEQNEKFLEERRELQRRVNDKLIDLDDIKRLQNNLTLVQEHEPISLGALNELISEGYVKTVEEGERIIITPKGRRALRNLGLQRIQLEQALGVGFTDEDRRQPENLARREQINQMSPEEREELLFQDATTGTGNRRAFDERADKAKAHASIEVDSLEWVNENMTFAAGDRILRRIASTIEDAVRQTVARGISELGSDELEQIELYRVSGKEFALTGPNQEVIEKILQKAKDDLNEETVTDSRNEVTPSITWGKGDNYSEAEVALNKAREKRSVEGKVAGRKERPVKSKRKTPKGRAQLDKDIDPFENIAELDLPREWQAITDSWATVEVGDIVEVITPQAVQFGLITKVTDKADKPRIEVAIGDRRFRFNPDRNWLINHPMSSPDDIAWITNDPAMADPDNIPQVLEEVSIGLMGKGGDAWYADLSIPFSTQSATTGEYMSEIYSPKKYKYKTADTVVRQKSENIKAAVKAEYQNMPAINLVHDVNEFRENNHELYHQILAEARASGLTSLRAVRGYYDPLHPEDGVYVFTAATEASSGMDGMSFEQAMLETIFHETVGHYGVRALFRNEQELRNAMYELVDAFNDGPNSLAKRMEGQLNLYGATSKDFDPDRKLLLGEEMLAYTVGLEMSGQLDVTPKQRNIIQRIIDWMKQWLNRYFGRFGQRYVTISEQRRDFWNDDRVQELIVRSTNFVRNGPRYEKSQYEHGRAPFIRDGQIFQWNILQILRTATKKLSNRQRKELKQKYGGDLNNVPTELPIFPQEGTMKQYEQALNEVSKSNNEWGIKKIELDMLGLSKDEPWYFFRDLTYRELMELHQKSKNIGSLSDVERYWYREYLPNNLVRELDEMFETLDNLSIVGPLPQYAAEHDKFLLNYDNYTYDLQNAGRAVRIRKVTNDVSYQAMQSRITDILEMKVNPKNTKINYDIFEAHARSSRAFRVYAEGHQGNPRLSVERAANLIFHGDPDQGNWLHEDGRHGMDSIPEETQQEIRDVIELAQTNGVDIGFDPETGRWVDDPNPYMGSWREYTPIGPDVSEDYRIHLIKTEGGGYPEMPRHDQHFQPNFMHIRSSVATFADPPSWAEYDAANEKFARKAWYLIELQTDWSTKYRTGFVDRDDMFAQHNRGVQLYTALKNAAVDGNKRTDAMLTHSVTKLSIDALSFMPDTWPEDHPARARVMPILDESAQRRFGKTYKELDEDWRQREVWQLLYIKEHKKIQDKLNEAVLTLDTYVTENDVAFGRVKSLDARMMDMMDQYAVNDYINLVRKAVQNIKRNLEAHENPANTSSMLYRQTIANSVDNQRWRNQNSDARLRLPWVKDKIKDVLTKALNPIGVTEAQIDNILDAYNARHQKTYTYPKDAAEALYNASHLGRLVGPQRRNAGFAKGREALNRALSEYANTNFWKTVDDDVARTTISNSPVEVSITTLQDTSSAQEDDIAITVSGSDASIAIFDKYKDDILAEYAREMVPLNVESVWENEANRSGSDEVDDFYESGRAQWKENNDLREYITDNLEWSEPDPFSTEASVRAELDNRNVHHSGDWYADYEDDAQEIVNSRYHESPEYMQRIYDDADANDENDEYIRLMEEEGQDAADEWLEEAQDNAWMEYQESPDYFEEVRETVDDIVQNRIDEQNPPYLFYADIPIAWDEDGDPTDFVDFEIRAENIGESYYVSIDGDWKDYVYTEEEAWQIAPAILSNYFNYAGIRPPAGAFMGPPEGAVVPTNQDRKEQAKKSYPMPNTEVLATHLQNNFEEKTYTEIDLVSAYREMVTIDKRFNNMSADRDDRTSYIHNFYPDSPMHPDKYWRVTALRYILADAVRRGFGAVVWTDGMSTSSRGGDGMGLEDRIQADKIEWSVETLTVGGKEQDVLVLHNVADVPYVVTNQNKTEVLGFHLANLIDQQIAGKWQPEDAPQRPIIKLPFTAEEVKNGDHYTVTPVTSELTGTTSYAVHDILENRFIGFYDTEEQAQLVINEEGVEQVAEGRYRRAVRYEQQIRGTQDPAARTINRPPIGSMKTSGVTYPSDLGVKRFSLFLGYTMNGFKHTWPVPKLAGARLNYEKMTVDAWNKELKKYGTQIQTSYIELPSSRSDRAYEREGQIAKIPKHKDAAWSDKYGATEVVEISGPNKGWVIMTEKSGVLNGRIYDSYEDALKNLAFMREQQSVELKGSKVFTIVLNDEIKNTFSKPIAPFHLDRRLEEHLKSAKAKFKDRGGTLAERFRKIRSRVRSAWQHELLDMLFGLRKALETGGVSDRSYMAARIANAGLEARVKSALYFGYPVWDEDTTSYAGKGLMDILSGIGTDPKLWGHYMAGLRGKELMLEGYDNLSPEEQQQIQTALSQNNIEGATVKEKIWNLVVATTKRERIDFESGLALTEADRKELGETASRFYEYALYHFRVAGDPPRLDDGSIDPMFAKGARLRSEWQKRKIRNGPVVDMRTGSKWERKERNMIWDLMDDPRVKDKQGRQLHASSGRPKKGQYSKWEKAEWFGVKTEEEARRIVHAVQEKALEKQAQIDKNNLKKIAPQIIHKVQMKGREKVFTYQQLVALESLGEAYPQFERVREEFAEWNSKLLDFAEEAGIINPETRKIWESEFYVPLYRVVDDRLGGPFGKGSGIHVKKVIKRLEGGMPSDKQAQAVWYAIHGTPEKGKHIKKGHVQSLVGKKALDKAIKDGHLDVMYGKALGVKGEVGEGVEFVAATPEGVEYLTQQGNNVGDVIDNIMMNVVKMIDTATENHWKKMAVDDLIETGQIKKSPIPTSKELMSMGEVKKILKEAGFDTESLPTGFAQQIRQVTTLNPLSEKDGYISIFRNGKREYYTTDDTMLYESLTMVRRKNFHQNWAWLTLPKRFYTGSITLAPPFMAANAFRDAVSASISGRDDFIPFIDSMKGFISAISNDEVMRTMTSAGATFEAGYITAGDSRATQRMIEKAIAKADFQKTLVDNPGAIVKAMLLATSDSYMKVGSSFENASRVALYKAARESGKSKLRSAYEGLDIMDFSMRGSNAAIQWLTAVVPFMNARMQGLYRTGRGFKERPIATLMKGSLYTFAALAVWAQFRDDERYKQLQDWDKATYHHFWLGDEHFRVPRAFEIGAIFTTIPEMWLEYLYSQENDAGKDLIRMWAFMLGETFAFNPIPQAALPMVELMSNYNQFTGRQIVSPYDKRLPQDQYRPSTSETMRELAKIMPDITIGEGNIKSPQHLESLFRGYTGTLGKYLLDASDWFVRQSLDYPLPPTPTPAQHWLKGRFFLGSDPQPRTKQEEEFYRMMEKVTGIQQSLSFYERTGVDDERFKEILETESAYINVSDALEAIREDVRELNREEMSIWYAPKMTPEKKREVVNKIILTRNKLFQEAYKLRPGGELNAIEEPAEREALINLILEWGVNNSDLAKKRLIEESPTTAEIIEHIQSNMEKRQLTSLSKASR